jgi:hypothetical protein
MRREFPNHPLWADPVFERDDYQAFAKDVELSLLEVEEPEELRIRKTLPAIAERLNTLHQGLARDINDWGRKTSDWGRTTSERLDSIEAILGDLLGGRVSITLNSTRTTVRPTAVTADATITASSPALSAVTTPFHSVRTSPSPSPPPEAALPSTTSRMRSSTTGKDHHDKAPSYILSRSISTVPQLWREWTVGIRGGPSVQGLEDQYGPRWRLKHSEKVFYGRRKVVIDEIRRRQAQGISAGAAVEEVELMRQRGRLSLYQLYKLLNRQKKNT